LKNTNPNAYTEQNFEIGKNITQVKINSLTTKNIVCDGDIGNITINITGGTGTYRYLINGFADSFIPLPSNGIIPVNNTAIINRTLKIKDSNNCEVLFLCLD